MIKYRGNVECFCRSGSKNHPSDCGELHLESRWRERRTAQQIVSHIWEYSSMPGHKRNGVEGVKGMNRVKGTEVFDSPTPWHASQGDGGV